MHRIFSFTIFIHVLLFAQVGFAAPRSIYIDASASSGGKGSLESPYKTFAEINWSKGGINSISDWVDAGHDVYINLKRGSIWVGETLRFAASGTATHPIRLQPYGQGPRPVIDRNIKVYGVNGEHCIDFNGNDHITVDNIELVDGYYLIYADSSTENIKITSCVGYSTNIESISRKGFILRGSNHIIGGSYSRGNEVFDINGGDKATAGSHIAVSNANNIIISYNKVHGDGKSTGVDGILIINSSNFLVEYNESFGHQFSEGEDGIDVKNSSDGVIRFNRFEGNRHFGANLQNMSDSKIYGNLIKDNGYPGVDFNDSTPGDLPCENNDFYSNVVIGNSSHGVRINSQGGEGVDSIKVFNNTFVNNGANRDRSQIFIGSGAGHVVKNNIMYTGAACDRRLLVKSNGANASVDFNHYYYEGGSARIEWDGIEYSLSKPPLGQEKNGSEGNPVFADIIGDKLWLLEGSPCLGSGLELGSMYREALQPNYQPYDYRQPVMRGNSWSIGAYEGSSKSNSPFNPKIKLRLYDE